MVTVMLYRRPYNNCTLVLVTVSHNCSDIGRINAYINTRRAQLGAIQTINSDEAGFDVVCAASDITVLVIRSVKSIAVICSPRNLRTSVLQNQFLLDG